jgi:polar amino acid transport system substrate-binding protein
LSLLEAGAILGLYPPYRLEKDRPYIHPYSLPLYTETVAVFCRRGIFDAPGKKNWPADFYGLTVSRNLGFTMVGAGFWQPVTDGKIKLLEYKNNRESLKAVVVDRTTDCYINDRLSIQVSYADMARYFIANNAGERLHRLEEVFQVTEQQAYIGYSAAYLSKRPENLEFVKRMDEGIAQLLKSPQYEKIIQRYLVDQMPDQTAKPNDSPTVSSAVSSTVPAALSVK